MASFKCSECVAKGICNVQKFDPLCDEFREKLADTMEVQKPSHNTGSPKLCRSCIKLYACVRSGNDVTECREFVWTAA